MTRYEDGQYIRLIWEYGTPNSYCIKGHVSHEAGIETLIGEGVIFEETEVGLGVQKYGRWSMEPGGNGNQHFLGTYTKPGRGRFKVTEFGVGIFAEANNE